VAGRASVDLQRRAVRTVGDGLAPETGDRAAVVSTVPCGACMKNSLEAELQGALPICAANVGFSKDYQLVY
jgi:hypothetical protein